MSEWAGFTARREIFFSRISLCQKVLPLASGASVGGNICENTGNNTLLLSGKLDRHWVDINHQAEYIFSQLVKQMATQEGITEQFKADSQMVWVGQMNNICACAKEIVNVELIFADIAKSTCENKKEMIYFT